MQEENDLAAQVEELRALAASGALPQADLSRLTGELGEAVAAHKMSLDGSIIVGQHYPGARPQGLDVEALSPDGRLEVAEIKSTLADSYHRPGMSRLADGSAQGSDAWFARNSKFGQVEFSEADLQDGRIASSVYQVDFHPDGDAIGKFDVDSEGRVDSSPIEMWSLADVVAASTDGAQGSSDAGLGAWVETGSEEGSDGVASDVGADGSDAGSGDSGDGGSDGWGASDVGAGAGSADGSEAGDVGADGSDADSGDSGDGGW